MLLRAPVVSLHARGALRGAPLRARAPARIRGAFAPARASVEPEPDAEAEAAAAAAAPQEPLRKRRLIVLRHADAEPRRAAEDPNDASRALSARGKREARAVARQLASRAKWMPDLILTSDSARTRQTLAEMCAQAPKLAKARVVEVPEFYSASGCGADALASVNAALTRHAAPGDATALLLGHNPGWEEAVALLTCREAAAAPMRTAQGALLRSEQRSWRDALTGGWARRGDVAPPPRKTRKAGASAGAAPPAEGEAKRPADMTDAELKAALRDAEKAAARQAKAKAPKEDDKNSADGIEKGKKSKKKREIAAVTTAEDAAPSAAQDAALELLVARVNAEPAIADSELDAWWASQGLGDSDVLAAAKAEKARVGGGGRPVRAKAVQATLAKLRRGAARQEAAAAKAAAREARAAVKEAQQAAAAELAAAAAEFEAEKAAEAAAAKAAAREAARREKAEAAAREAAAEADAAANDAAAAALEAAAAAVAAPKGGAKGAKKSQGGHKGGEHLFAASASKASAKHAHKKGLKAVSKALNADAEASAQTEEGAADDAEAALGVAARARREAAEAAAAAAWALETMRASEQEQ